MSIFYLDTSVIVKRYRNEEGTAFIDHLFDTVIGSKDHSLTTSTLSILEFIAAMRRAQKGKVITQDHFENAVYIFNRELNHISLRPITEDILTKAIDVVMNHTLRTADAIHFSTVLELIEIMADFNETIILISNDKEMCQAALNEGIEVLSAADNEIERLSSILGLDQ